MKTQTTIHIEESNYFQAEVKIPTKETQKALDELDSKKGKSFESVDELFDDLDS